MLMGVIAFVSVIVLPKIFSYIILELAEKIAGKAESHYGKYNIDPESSYTSTNSQGLDYFGMPSVRSWGFNLRMGF